MIGFAALMRGFGDLVVGDRCAALHPTADGHGRRSSRPNADLELTSLLKLLSSIN